MEPFYRGPNYRGPNLREAAWRPRHLLQAGLASASSARALAALAEQEIAARRIQFPSQLAPQIVLAWLPLRDVPSALSVSSGWRAASAPLFQTIAQDRGLARESDDTPWREVIRLTAKRVYVVRAGAVYDYNENLARLLGVFEEWEEGNSSGILNSGDVGDLIAEVHSGDPSHRLAFRLDRNGRVFLMQASGVIIHWPGETPRWCDARVQEVANYVVRV